MSEVENPLVGRRAVGPDEGPLGGAAVGDRQVIQVAIAGLAQRRRR